MYVDPGSGSYLLQVVIAAFLGASFGLRTRLRALTRRFRRQPPPDEGERRSS